MNNSKYFDQVGQITAWNPGGLPVGSRRAFLRTAAALTAMIPEVALAAKLAAAPGPATIWWRSDDVGVDTLQFVRLLALAQRRQAPVALAVVPANLKASCTARILNCPQATVVQHGIAHANNAASGKQIELGGRIDRKLLAERLKWGRERLSSAFGGRFLPMQAPPWNRIDPDVTSMLPSLGFSSLSTCGREPAAEAAPGLRQINIHLDLYHWFEPRGALTYEQAVSQLTTLVRAANGRPVGLLTHHSVMNEEAFVTLERLLTYVQQQKNMRLVGIGDLVGKVR
ncbi:hypothetical protein [Benzoatithermus flavus]|uniref:Polysaccharide deacetylase n=1 Tax=Benzoatithermus flavus TaxID=3108223 RepID=A0ABU8XVJ2_9PROT